jgi:hypothetical protein
MQQLRFLYLPIITVKTVLLFFSVTLISNGCRDRIPEQKEPVVKRTSLNIPVIADSIVYDVVIRNPDPDEWWADENLKSLNKEALLDIIFNAVYRGELVAYDYFSQKAMTAREILEVENAPDYSRENIGRIQFAEEWYFDEENLRMEKRVNSLTLGYEVLDARGDLRGYKPLFMVKLN